MPATTRKTKTNGAKTSAHVRLAMSSSAIQARVEAVDWTRVHADLGAQGWAIAPQLLTHVEADSVAGLHHQEQGLRNHLWANIQFRQSGWTSLLP
jgi:uncharacterized protein